MRSRIYDVAAVLLGALLAFCTPPRPAHAQAISWSHGLTTSTALTIGMRVDPTSSRFLDSRLRQFSPYKNAKRPNGAYLLPDTRLLSRTCDVQHLGWLGIGNWSGPRIVPQAMWLPIGAAGTWILRRAHAPAPATLSFVGMATYTGVRAAIIPGYHFDPLGYSASILSWGVEGAALGGGKYDWKLPVALAALWATTFSFATPWADDPARCGA